MLGGLARLDGVQADFALAFWMVHEVRDKARFLAEVHAVLKDQARLLLVEPRGHVGKEAFERTVELAVAAGFTVDAPTEGAVQPGRLALEVVARAVTGQAGREAVPRMCG